MDTVKNYKELLADTRSFNANLSSDRRHRLPFIDSHTGIAQVDCSLWHSRDERQAAIRPDSVIYKYPAQRWQKRRREYLIKSEAYSICNNVPSANCELEMHINQERLMNISPIANTEHNNSQPSASGDYLIKYTNNFPTQPHGPPRTDSTGSHSIADSDSRDQSSTNSQTHDSPRRTPTEQDDHISFNNIESHFLTPKGQSVIHSNFSNHAKKSRPDLIDCNLQEKEGDTQISRAQQTREAIRLARHKQCRLSKKKNAGQSLIRSNISNSILVKNGRKQYENVTVESITHDVQNEGMIDYNEDSCDEHLGKKNASCPKAIRCNGSKRPYVCSICDQTYKTRPGLSYHFVHIHKTVLPKNLPSITVGRKDMKTVKAKSSKRLPVNHEQTTRVLRNTKLKPECETTPSLNNPSSQIKYQIEDQSNNLPAECTLRCSSESSLETETSIVSESITPIIINGHQQPVISDRETDISSHLSPKRNNGDISEMEVKDDFPKIVDGLRKADKNGDAAQGAKKARPNPFCDFCHGTTERNRRTRLPEALISCSSCGSSGHPSCLRFSENICSSVKKYNWQCIDCKTCSICNKADNEHQLLFCDDCDRSYHTYCMNPPLNELPEGNWTCYLCLVEYYNNEQ